MSQHRRRRGSESQRVVADYLRANGWPYAEPIGAGRQGSDITGLIGIDLEIKARRDLDLTGALRQIQARLRADDIGLAVVRPDGFGPSRVAQWPAVMTLETANRLLRNWSES